MSVVAFDTLAFAKRLEQHGFSSEQAQVMVELQKETINSAIDNSLATKADIRALIESIKESRDAAKADTQALREEVKADISALIESIKASRDAAKADTQALREELKADISRLDKELFLIKWVVLTTFALVAIPAIRTAFGV